MTRPAADPLRALSPEAVGLDAAERVHARMGLLAWALQPAVMWQHPEPTSLASSQVAQTVAHLVVYAQRGLPCGDWTEPRDAWDGLVEVLAWLYDGPARQSDALAALEDAAQDGIGLALSAAYARCQLEAGHAVTLEPLRMLAGVSLRTVRHDVAEGILVATESSRGREREVTAMQARRWLAARGVPGYVAG